MPIQGKHIQFDFGFQMTTSGIDLVEKHVRILHWDNCFFCRFGSKIQVHTTQPSVQSACMFGTKIQPQSFFNSGEDI